MYGKGKAIEAGLASIEGEASAVIRSLLDGQPPPEPGTPEFEALVVFIHFQWTRTPVALSREIAMSSTLLAQLERANPGLPLPEDEVRALRSTVKESVASFFFSAARHWILLQDLGVKSLHNQSATEFILGDAPAVLHNQWCRRITNWGVLGLACSGLLIALPISPTKLVLLYDTDIYTVGGVGDIVSITNREEVAALNRLQFAMAEHAVYYRSSSVAADVAAIPASTRDGRLGARAARFVDVADPRAHMVQVSNLPLNVDLPYGTLRLKYEAQVTPLRRRIQRWRPTAYELALTLEDGRDAESGSRRMTRYRRVED